VSCASVGILSQVASFLPKKIRPPDFYFSPNPIGNTYLEAETKEKVFFVASPEFGDLAGHTLIIVKALYGLWTSRACWHNRFADCLCDMGFEPSKGEPDIWMWQNGDVYEYIGVYVDDLAIVAKYP
jgi:Reverse transcriptase (RNA-dependent DNA polymerase)